MSFRPSLRLSFRRLAAVPLVRFVAPVVIALLVLRSVAAQPWSRDDAAAAPATRPFGVGEHDEYDVRFGPLRVGRGTMEIAGVDTIRGHAAYHAVLSVQGGIPFFRVDDRYDSWFDTSSFNSLRFTQRINEGRYHRDQTYEIDPAARRYVTRGDTLASVDDPLDDTSVLYYVRTLALPTGAVYRLNRYYVADQNPIEVRILRRERVTVPAGTFDAVVVQPVIKTSGIFADRGHALLWFSNDGTRRLLRMQASLSFGTLSLQLRAAEHAR
jgi:hypothetical protein